MPFSCQICGATKTQDQRAGKKITRLWSWEYDWCKDCYVTELLRAAEAQEFPRFLKRTKEIEVHNKKSVEGTCQTLGPEL